MYRVSFPNVEWGPQRPPEPPGLHDEMLRSIENEKGARRVRDFLVIYILIKSIDDVSLQVLNRNGRKARKERRRIGHFSST